jgi:NitT/TauT family transport system permease protein
MKISLLVFCIAIFMVTSFLGIIFEVKKEELDYARSLKMNEWKAVWEVIILGKADQFLEAIKQNFAIAWMMLAMVENLCRAEGGIGVILFQENKQFHLDAVYSIQILVLFVGIGLDWTLGWIRRVFCPYSVITLDRK